jgi:hypothetical protein
MVWNKLYIISKLKEKQVINLEDWLRSNKKLKKNRYSKNHFPHFVIKTHIGCACKAYLSSGLCLSR